MESKSGAALVIKRQVSSVTVLFAAHPAGQQHVSLLTCLFNDAFDEIEQLNTPNILYSQNARARVRVYIYIYIYIYIYVRMSVYVYTTVRVKLSRSYPSQESTRTQVILPLVSR